MTPLERLSLVSLELPGSAIVSKTPGLSRQLSLYKTSLSGQGPCSQHDVSLSYS